ncbi:MAG TPA: F0F1 ATP synthase subunit delta [Burkholderiales bacterium]|nr:F0F1 ATP synthase subunit delta [Burkholderiales bacterium]
MAEKLTAARPYAEAVFALARTQNALPAWSETLALAAAVAGDARIRQLASDPRVERARFLGLFLDICGARLDPQGANFIRLLVENRRLNLLPEIASLYEGLKAEAEARVEATVTSAFSLEPAQLKVLEQGLQLRLGRAVHLTAAVDRSLVGGVVLRAGDLVIDGSVRGRLAALATELHH